MMTCVKRTNIHYCLGASGRDRTGDLLITNELLCQLSHGSMVHFIRFSCNNQWFGVGGVSWGDMESSESCAEGGRGMPG